MNTRADDYTASRASRVPKILLIAFTAIWAVLAISPVDRADWLLENLLVFAAIPVLIGTRHRMPFSNASYICLFAFFVMHAIGAHYTYALVPYDRGFEALTGSTLSEITGWQRNHYDRLVHFSYGALLLRPSMELIARYAPPISGWRWVLPVLFVVSHSAIFELLEWMAVLVVAPDLGTAYLGTQGDEWDAQKDMALATVGAVLSACIVALTAPRLNER